MNNIVNVKTIGGVVVGVAIGHFVVKSRSVLFLTAMGLAGGVLAHYLTKGKSSSTTPSKSTTSPTATKVTFMQKVEDSIGDELDIENEDVQEEQMESFYGVNKEMLFDEQLGYKPPYSTKLEFEKPSDFMDINFNE